MRHSDITSIDTFAPTPEYPITQDYDATPRPKALSQPPARQRHIRHPFALHSNPLHQTRQNPAHRFSQKTISLVEHAISHSWAPSTASKYSNAIHHFFKFCEIEKVPTHLRFPTDEFVLCAFAASGAGKSSYTTINNKISALKAWHHRHNADWKGGIRLRLILRGVKNLAPQSSLKPPRPPINAKMLSQLIDGLDLSDTLDAAVAACATVAFWGQCRLGELLSTSAQSLSTSSIPSRENIHRSTRNKRSFLLFLPKTKTKRNGEEVVLTSQHGNSDPLKALQNHFNINHLSRKSPLFAYSSDSGTRNLTRRRFLARCNSIWSKLGYPHTTGHNFRIGGTTELLLAGVPPDIVKTLGRWTSDSFLRYWRFLDDIAPRYTHKIPHRTSQKRKRQLYD